jgi:hypothetical protein
MSSAKQNKFLVVVEVAEALEDLVVRFPIEGFAFGDQCKCLQFEDNNDCRHLRAVKALKKAKKFLRAK